MGKGGYNGGSSVVGFEGSFTGSHGTRLIHATDVDAHRTKEARNAARAAAGRTSRKSKVTTKLTKTERQAEALARKNFGEAPAEVVVEHRVKGTVVRRRTVRRS